MKHFIKYCWAIVKINWPILLGFGLAAFAQYREPPPPYTSFECVTRADTTFYEVIVTKGKKIKAIELTEGPAK